MLRVCLHAHSCVLFGLIGLADIDKALLKIEEVASNHDGVAAEEALILRG